MPTMLKEPWARLGALLAHISSAGLRIFYEAPGRIDQAQGKIAIRRLSENVKRVWELVDMSSEIPIFATQEQAIESLK
ncbi:MAG TPA: STAS domain-containing protein [Candidatus Acidoferrales bacterium]|nr:STAS domain-containing protein [Candidatus Acidoferrales bacterium]